MGKDSPSLRQDKRSDDKSVAYYEAWDYKRLKHLEMMGIRSQEVMRNAKSMSPEAVVGFIHQLSPWNLKTTGVAILEAYAEQYVSSGEVRANAKPKSKLAQSAPKKPKRRNK